MKKLSIDDLGFNVLLSGDDGEYTSDGYIDENSTGKEQPLLNVICDTIYWDVVNSVKNYYSLFGKLPEIGTQIWAGDYYRKISGYEYNLENDKDDEDNRNYINVIVEIFETEIREAMQLEGKMEVDRLEQVLSKSKTITEYLETYHRLYGKPSLLDPHLEKSLKAHIEKNPDFKFF